MTWEREEVSLDVVAQVVLTVFASCISLIFAGELEDFLRAYVSVFSGFCLHKHQVEACYLVNPLFLFHISKKLTLNLYFPCDEVHHQ